VAGGALVISKLLPVLKMLKQDAKCCKLFYFSMLYFWSSCNLVYSL